MPITLTLKTSWDVFRNRFEFNLWREVYLRVLDFLCRGRGSEVGGLNSPLLRLCSEGEDCDSSC